MDPRLLTSKRHLSEMDFDRRRNLLVEITKKCLRLIAKRARYGVNPVIYEKGALGDNYPEISLLEYAIAEKERYYRKMGRYRHETQYPIIDLEEPESLFFGVDQKDQTFRQRIEIPDLIGFYIGIVNGFCEPGENPGRTSLIADLDVDCLDEIHSRLQFGRYIIDGKIASRPELKELIENYTAARRPDVLKHIVFKEQERKVIEAAIKYSEDNGLGLDEDKLSGLIKDFIRINTNVQFEYLRRFYNVDLGTL